jgi:hypothetical protein
MPVRAAQLNIALPAIAADVRVSPANAIWIVNVYQIDKLTPWEPNRRDKPIRLRGFRAQAIRCGERPKPPSHVWRFLE